MEEINETEKTRPIRVNSELVEEIQQYIILDGKIQYPSVTNFINRAIQEKLYREQPKENDSPEQV